MFRWINSRILSKDFQFSRVHQICRMSLDVQAQPLENLGVTEAKKRPAEESAETEDAKEQKTDTFERIKRKNYALMMGYLGKDYFGMQRNPDVETVEGDLYSALFKANLIPSTTAETMQTLKFQRAARTDKGVSAVRQVVNLKLPNNPDKNAINEHLPKEIKIFSIRKVTKGFNSKSSCCARTYSYTLPTFAFAPENEAYAGVILKEIDVEKRMQDLSTIDGKPCNEYRIPKESIERIRALLKKYDGSHNFHNFTSKIRPMDPRASRFIISFICGEPFMYKDTEFITLTVKGQSFIMHQIRKMIGVIIGILRNNTTEEVFDRVFTQQKLDIPRAPGLGLILERVHYDYYNKKFGSDGIHETLDWAEHEEEVSEFMNNYILKHIAETEIEQKNMLDWLANMPFHSFDFRRDANSENSKEVEEEKSEAQEEKPQAEQA